MFDNQKFVNYLLGLMGREPTRQTSEPDSNPSWDTTVHPVCKTFNVMCVV